MPYSIDIEPNTGPTNEPVCEYLVTWSQHGIACDGCAMYVITRHVNVCQYVPRLQRLRKSKHCIEVL